MKESQETPAGPFPAHVDPRDPRASGLLTGSAEAAGPGWALVGLPYDGGIPGRPGARFAPPALRQALAAFTTHDGVHTLQPIADVGDLPLQGISGAAAHRRIEQTAASLLRHRGRVAFIGGDHGCTGSIVRGLATARPDCRLGLVNIDAHLDVREYVDPEALSSGTPFRRALETPILSGDRVAMLGIRRFANSEYYLRWARERAILLLDVDAVAADPGAAAAAALHRLSDADALYVSIDLDAADAATAPGVSAPGIGGLSSREMIALVASLAADPRLVAVDIMELSPPYDIDGRTARLAARLLLEVLAASVG